jgi:hypothetical protein
VLLQLVISTYKSKYAAAKDTQGTTFMPFATPKNLNTDGQKQELNAVLDI